MNKTIYCFLGHHPPVFLYPFPLLNRAFDSFKNVVRQFSYFIFLTTHIFRFLFYLFVCVTSAESSTFWSRIRNSSSKAGHDWIIMASKFCLDSFSFLFVFHRHVAMMVELLSKSMDRGAPADLRICNHLLPSACSIHRYNLISSVAFFILW